MNTKKNTTTLVKLALASLATALAAGCGHHVDRKPVQLASSAAHGDATTYHFVWAGGCMDFDAARAFKAKENAKTHAWNLLAREGKNAPEITIAHFNDMGGVPLAEFARRDTEVHDEQQASHAKKFDADPSGPSELAEATLGGLPALVRTNDDLALSKKSRTVGFTGSTIETTTTAREIVRLTYYVVVGDEHIEVRFRAPVAEWQQWSPAFDAVVGSVRFTGC